MDHAAKAERGVPLPELNNRDIEILVALGDGLMNKEIACSALPVREHNRVSQAQSLRKNRRYRPCWGRAVRDQGRLSAAPSVPRSVIATYIAASRSGLVAG